MIEESVKEKIYNSLEEYFTNDYVDKQKERLKDKMHELYFENLKKLEDDYSDLVDNFEGDPNAPFTEEDKEEKIEEYIEQIGYDPRLSNAKQDLDVGDWGPMPQDKRGLIKNSVEQMLETSEDLAHIAGGIIESIDDRVQAEPSGYINHLNNSINTASSFSAFKSLMSSYNPDDSEVKFK